MDTDKQREERRRASLAAFNRLGKPTACAVLAMVLAGCSHSKDADERLGSGFMHVLAPQEPTFLAGPASVLLTNASGYTARAEIRTPDAGLPEPERVAAGQLFCRGTKLLFAPDPVKTGDKKLRIEGFSFVLDAATGSGFVLSEPLQGYAPLSARGLVTNMVVETPATMPQKIGGYLCTPQLANLQDTLGGAAGFTVFRAKELQGVPSQIVALSNSAPFTLTLSKIRLEPPPAELFSPPDGFSKYTSAEAMADEQAARQRTMKRGIRETPEPPDTGIPGSQQARPH